MPTGLALLLLTAAMGLAFRLGWWAVPLTAALWGLLRPALSGPALLAGCAAALAALGWLGYGLLTEPDAFRRLAERVGAVLGLPGVLLVVVSVVFPALLGWSAAALAGGLADLLGRKTGRPRNSTSTGGIP